MKKERNVVERGAADISFLFFLIIYKQLVYIWLKCVDISRGKKERNHNCVVVQNHRCIDMFISSFQYTIACTRNWLTISQTWNQLSVTNTRKASFQFPHTFSNFSIFPQLILLPHFSKHSQNCSFPFIQGLGREPGRSKVLTKLLLSHHHHNYTIE